VFSNAGMTKKGFSNSVKKLAQIRLVIFEKNAKMTPFNFEKNAKTRRLGYFNKQLTG